MTEQEAKEMARKHNAENVGKPEEKKGFLDKAKEAGKAALSKVGEAMKIDPDQQMRNAASADMAFASPEVRSNVENESEAGKALTEANATDIAKGSGFEETNKALAGEGEFGKAAEATQHTADAQGNPNPETKTTLDEAAEESKGQSISENAGNGAQDRFKDLIDRTKGNYDYLNDYYKNSATNAWNDLGKGDQRILLYDQLGTLLRNNAKYKPKLYGAFGNVVSEGQDAGDEKSKLDNFLSENLTKGLERRNSRLDNSLEQQMQIANFPEKLEMQLRQTWEGLKMNNRAKTHLISLLKDVDFMDALKAGAVSIAANGQIVDKASGAILGML
jgi:hypothetical protein